MFSLDTVALADAMKAAEELEPLMTSGTGGSDGNGGGGGDGGGNGDGQHSGDGNMLQNQQAQLSVCLKFEIRCPLSLSLFNFSLQYIYR